MRIEVPFRRLHQGKVKIILGLRLINLLAGFHVGPPTDSFRKRFPRRLHFLFELLAFYAHISDSIRQRG